jgi:hypothetical protein
MLVMRLDFGNQPRKLCIIKEGRYERDIDPFANYWEMENWIK